MPHIVFFGTPAFSEIILKHLVDAGYSPIAVVTNPDQPVGRKQVLTASSVKLYASKHGIPVLQPQRLKDALFLGELREFKPDVCIIASYGKILPAELLAIPSKGTINVHPSLLPKYRGATPIQTAILKGETETGVTLMLTDTEMDHGPILAQRELPITNYQLLKTTYTQLHNALADLGGTLLVEILPQWLAGKITAREQNHAQATYTKLLTKEDGRIDWHKSAIEIERQIRAFEVWPGTWTIFGSGTSEKPQPASAKSSGEAKRVKITSGQATEEKTDLPPGTILKTKSGDLGVATGDYLLIVEILQFEGGEKITGASALNGRLLVADEIFYSHLPPE